MVRTTAAATTPETLPNHSRVFSRSERRRTSGTTSTSRVTSGGVGVGSSLKKPSPSTVTESTAGNSDNSGNNQNNNPRSSLHSMIGGGVAPENIINSLCQDAAGMIESVIETIMNGDPNCGTHQLPIREIVFCSDRGNMNSNINGNTVVVGPSNGADGMYNSDGECLYSDGVSCLELPDELASTHSATPAKQQQQQRHPPQHRTGKNTKREDPPALTATSNDHRRGSSTSGSSTSNSHHQRSHPNYQHPSIHKPPKRTASPLADIHENCDWTVPTALSCNFAQESQSDLVRISSDLAKQQQTNKKLVRRNSDISEEGDGGLNPVAAFVSPEKSSQPQKSETGHDLYKYMLQRTPRTTRKTTGTDDITLTPGSLIQLDFERDLVVQWGLQRNVIPGLDRWSGVLRRSNKPKDTTEKPLGLVQGFWIRRYPRPIKDESKKQPKRVRKTFRPSWGPKEIKDLAELNNIDSSLGYFWQKTLKLGWPKETTICLPASKADVSDSDISMISDDSSSLMAAAAALPRGKRQPRLVDKENDIPAKSSSCLNNPVAARLHEYKQQAARKRQRSRKLKEQRAAAAAQKQQKHHDPMPQVVTDECCLITQVWVTPQHRGDDWGLIMAEKAATAIPKRYNRLKETANLTPGGDLSLVLACPPYNKRLQEYFTSSKGGWNTSWDRDFLVK